MSERDRAIERHDALCRAYGEAETDEKAERILTEIGLLECAILYGLVEETPPASPPCGGSLSERRRRG